MSDNVLRKNIIRLREEREWSQAELARRIKLDNTALNKIEKGTRKVSSTELEDFSRVFDVSTDYLLGNLNSHRENNSGAVDLKNDPVVLSYGGKPVSDEDMTIIKAILARHNKK